MKIHVPVRLTPATPVPLYPPVWVVRLPRWHVIAVVGQPLEADRRERAIESPLSAMSRSRTLTCTSRMSLASSIGIAVLPMCSMRSASLPRAPCSCLMSAEARSGDCGVIGRDLHGRHRPYRLPALALRYGSRQVLGTVDPVTKRDATAADRLQVRRRVLSVVCGSVLGSPERDATAADRLQVRRRVLSVVSAGEPLTNLADMLTSGDDVTFPFPADVCCELAADALRNCSATRSSPISLAGARNAFCRTTSSGATPHTRNFARGPRVGD